MKYNYKPGRLVRPDGKRSNNLKCIECGEPQMSTYVTEDNKYICISCKIKDEKGLL